MPSTKARKARINSAAELAANKAREARETEQAKTAVASLRLEFVRHGCGPLWWPSYSAPADCGWPNHLAWVRSSMAQRADNFRRLAERETVAFPKLSPGERAFLAMFDKLQDRGISL